jgi:hypothetical protein
MTDAYFPFITTLLRSSGIFISWRFNWLGERENSDGTVTLNAGIRSGLRGSASLEGCHEFVSQRDGRGAEGVSPRGVLHARPWPAVARETRSGTRYRRLASQITAWRTPSEAFHYQRRAAVMGTKVLSSCARSRAVPRPHRKLSGSARDHAKHPHY